MQNIKGADSFGEFLDADVRRLMGRRVSAAPAGEGGRLAEVADAMNGLFLRYGKEEVIDKFFLSVLPRMLEHQLVGVAETGGTRAEEARRIIGKQLLTGNYGRCDQIAVDTASPARLVLKTVEKMLFNEAATGSGAQEPSLEIGGGDGFTSSIIFDKQKITAGTDPVASAVAASKKFRVHRFVATADALSLPFQDETFRNIYSVHVIDHVPDRERFISEASRVLAPSGGLFFSDISNFFWDMHPAAAALKVLGLSDLAEEYKFIHSGDASHSFGGLSPDQYRVLLEKHGFVEINIKYFMHDALAFSSEIFRAYYFIFKNLARANGRMQADIKLRNEFYETVGNLYPGMIAEDKKKCAADGRGMHIFIHAKKKGVSSAPAPEDPLGYVASRIICPGCKTPLDTRTKMWRCSECGVAYPQLHGARLLIPRQAKLHAVLKSERPDLGSLIRIKAKKTLFSLGLRREI